MKVTIEEAPRCKNVLQGLSDAVVERGEAAEVLGGKFLSSVVHHWASPVAPCYEDLVLDIFEKVCVDFFSPV